MKNRNFLKNSIAILLPISMGIGVLFGTANRHVNSASAYTGASLPTTIKLNDPDESTIRGYYADLDNLEENERKGNNLLKNLKTILSDGQKYYNYDSGNLVWDMYEITDRDWEKSPAANIKNGSYNASTNTITNYVYEAGKTDESKNPYVRAYYMDRNQTNVVKAWGNHNQDATGINREHLWAKAEGFDGSGGAGARGDPMHLVAANGYANNIHSNYFYGYVDKTKSYEDVSSKYSTLGHNYRGSSKTYPSYTGKVFEPQDCDKGDIARAIFYMAARYNNIAGKSASQETFDADNPNLLLTNDLSKWESSGYTSTATSPGYHGLITDLLEWNRIDKPDAYEIHRNNLLYTNFTNNRNPFIDFPEWADFIWGDKSAPATPATDTLNGGGGGTSTVTVTSLEIVNKPTKLIYNSGESLDLTGITVKANKSDGTSETLTSSQYSVSPSEKLKTSDTEITISYGGKSASFAVAVRGISGETENITSYTFTSSKWAVAETNVGTWASGKDGSGFTANQGVQTTLSGTGSYATSTKSFENVKKVVVKYCTNKSDGVGSISLKIGTNPEENFGVTKPTSGTGTNLKEAVFNFDEGQNGTIKITVGCTTNSIYIYGVDVYEYSGGGATNVNVSSITLNKNSTTLEIGQSESLLATIAPENATIQLVSWSSSNSEIVEVSDEGEITAKSAGNATITCAALDGSGVTATCTIVVSAPVTLQSITLSGQYPTEFYLGDPFSSDGLIVTANYSDNTHIDVTDDVEITGYDMESESSQTVTVLYGDKTTSYTINVKSKGKIIEQKSVSLSIETYATNNSWADATQYTEIKADDNITLTASGTSISNTGKYYQSDKTWRFYQSEGGTLTISAPENGKIKGVTITFSVKDNGALLIGDETLTNKTKVTTNSQTVTIDVGSTSGTKGKASIANVVVDYEIIENIKYSLVSDVSDLRTGDKIVIGSYHSLGLETTYYSMSTAQNISPGLNLNIYAAETIVSDNLLTPSETTEFVTVVRNGNLVSFRLSDGKYLSTFSNTASITLVDEICPSAQFNIESLGSGQLDIIGTDPNHKANRLRINQGTDKVFVKFYANNYGDAPMIFKYQPQVEADTWAKDFLAKTESCSLTYWSSLASSYSQLSKAAKEEIYSVVSDPSTDMNYRAQAMARYEKTLSVKSADAFISEREVNLARPISLPIVAPNKETILIVVFALIGVSAIGGYYFIKRKKEDFS